MEEARNAAASERVALNQLINVALAEKVSALRTQEFFRERAGNADRRETLRILARAGAGNAPVPGDELPEVAKSKGKKRRRAKAKSLK